MTVSIRSIATVVPQTSLRQSDIRDVFAAQSGMSALGRRLVNAVFDASDIDTRHTVIEELAGIGSADGHHPGNSAPAAPTFFDPAARVLLSAGTGDRNDVYVKRSAGLFVSAACQALAAAPGIEAADVTHVVTVSCTGFFAPGPDYLVVRELGLRPSTQRYHLGFMGCYGAFPALRAARDFCRSTPEAVVLIVSAELCTLHLQTTDSRDAIVASSVFADGAAAAVVSARPRPAGQPVLQLDAFETVLTADGDADMAWSIGNQGFEMVLSSYVPRIIERHITGALAPLLATDPTLAQGPYRAIEHWAIHPGGRSILDRVQHRLDLTAEQLGPSREVLRRYGNMSSATVLFVLRAILHASSPPKGERIVAMAFGPGLTVETALLTRSVDG
jgi:predicted naringenin-chalcone synthase